MRIEHTVTTVSWIPSEAVTGVNKAIFASGFTHYDNPPPDVLGDIEQMGRDDQFRFANRLHAWIDVEDGRITGHGRASGSVMGATTVHIARMSIGRFSAGLARLKVRICATSSLPRSPALWIVSR